METKNPLKSKKKPPNGGILVVHPVRFERMAFRVGV